MKNTLQAGVTGSATVDVDRERTIDFMGEKARVYATPMLVRDIEMACRDLLGKHLDPGEDSVGTRVELDHLAATFMEDGWSVKWLDRPTWDHTVTPNVIKRTGTRTPGRGRRRR